MFSELVKLARLVMNWNQYQLAGRRWNSLNKARNRTRESGLFTTFFTNKEDLIIFKPHPIEILARGDITC